MDASHLRGGGGSGGGGGGSSGGRRLDLRAASANVAVEGVLFTTFFVVFVLVGLVLALRGLVHGRRRAAAMAEVSYQPHRPNKVMRDRKRAARAKEADELAAREAEAEGGELGGELAAAKAQSRDEARAAYNKQRAKKNKAAAQTEALRRVHEAVLHGSVHKAHMGLKLGVLGRFFKKHGDGAGPAPPEEPEYAGPFAETWTLASTAATRAVVQEDVTTLTKMLDKKEVDIEGRNTVGKTLYQLAVERKKSSVVRLLKARGADEAALPPRERVLMAPRTTPQPPSPPGRRLKMAAAGPPSRASSSIGRSTTASPKRASLTPWVGGKKGKKAKSSSAMRKK